MIAEPMTLLTDYVLAGVTGWLGWRLFSAREGQAVRSFWALAFAALAAAAAVGGSYHGFARSPVVWKVTVLAIGIASFAMLAGSAMRRRDRASLWMLGGVGVSVFAAGVQASGYTLDRNFNHNDMYHVIQTAAMLLFYIGARRLRDSSA
jgi:hypothetical protein